MKPERPARTVKDDQARECIYHNAAHNILYYNAISYIDMLLVYFVRYIDLYLLNTKEVPI